MVTSVCFVDDIQKSFNEAYRILKLRGKVIIGFIDAGSDLGKKYRMKRESSRFYREADFYTAEELVYFLEQAGFCNFEFNQTIFSGKEDLCGNFKKGHGEGSFVVIKGEKINA